MDRAVLFRLATNQRLERVVKAVPGGEQATWRAASRYVAGRTQQEALTTARELLARGHGVSVDLFGELVTDASTADRVVEDYEVLIGGLLSGDAEPPGLADAWVSVDLTHLALDVDPRAAADRL